ncbi:MAG: PIG-L family deacetylase [bacterium]
MMLMISRHTPAIRWLFIVLFMFLFSCAKRPEQETYFPETGKKAIAHRALELRSNLNVLSLALEPGYEDLNALAYFRLGKGARIMSAYLTNGEAGESDVRAEYPGYLAAMRRKEAGEALAYLDGDVYFFAMPHIVAARDAEWIRLIWPKEEVENKVINLIDEFKPDIILIARDWGTEGTSLRWSLFEEDVLSALHKMEQKAAEIEAVDHWKVSRVIVDDGDDEGRAVAFGEVQPMFGKDYRRIGAEAGEKYHSLFIQMADRKKEDSKYSVVYPALRDIPEAVNSELPPRHSPRLQQVGTEIEKLAEGILDAKKDVSLERLAAVMDSVDTNIWMRHKFSAVDQRALSNWKSNLENLRCSLLGVKVDVSIDETILGESQLAFVTILGVEGLQEGGNTNVYFGGLSDDWVINEWKDRKFPFRIGEQYRVLSPKELQLTEPAGMYGLQSARLDQPFYVFVVHKAPDGTKNFSHRTTIGLRFAPKLAKEILTPIVRIIPDERLIVRLTNHSRDGVRDTLQVKDAFVESTAGLFRLTQKETFSVDTLTLMWKESFSEGSYMFPIDFGGINIGKFVARQFEASVRPDKKIGFIPGVEDSPLEATLRRLGVDAAKVDPGARVAEQLQNLDVLVVDHRALTLKKSLKDQKILLDRFVENGGHLIYLAQDADVWDSCQMWDEIVLTHTRTFDENYPVKTDETHPFLKIPNPIRAEDWGEWLFQRAYHIVKVENREGFEMPVQTESGDNPFVLTRRAGKGRMTYIDLAFSPQMLNINPGVFRLLANILSI